MATIKAYTDLEQSKKLAEILPLESADMVTFPFDGDKLRTVFANDFSVTGLPDETPAWSLSALLGVLPKIGSEEPMIQKLYYANNPTERYICQYSLTNITDEYNNPVDACYEMILKLNELKML